MTFSSTNPAADRRRLATLSAEIDKLEIALEALRTEQKLIQDRLDAYAYPVSTLPSEIVSEILLQYIPAYPTRPPLHGDRSPRKLTQICSLWRQIALGTPALWRAIALPRNATRGLLHIAEQWLELSQSLPLSISAHLSHPQVAHDIATLTMEMLLLHRARWEHVVLRAPSGGPVVEGPFASLKNIDLMRNRNSQLPVAMTPATAPRLSTAFVRYTFDEVDLSNYLAWRQLTTLFLGPVWIGRVPAVLTQAGGLVRCRLDLADYDDVVSTWPEINLLALETFIVEFEDPSPHIVPFLRSLHVPGLKELYTYHDLGEQESEELPLLAAIIKDFGCNLERLCIPSRTKTLEDYRAVFPNIRNVEHVDFEIDLKGWGDWNI